jgi:toxin FitB
MNIIDSSLWIEYFGNGHYASTIEDVINDIDNLIVPTVTLTEVFKWVLRERNEMAALSAVSVMKYGTTVELTEIIAINAAYYGNQLKLPLADSFIFSTAQYYNATIYTMDKHFKGLKNVKYFGREM